MGFAMSLTFEEAYLQREAEDWDGQEPLYSEALDEYYLTTEECIHILNKHNLILTKLRLLLCAPQYAWELDPHRCYWEILPDFLPVPLKLQAAFSEFNKFIRNYKEPLSWTYTYKRPTQESLERFIKENPPRPNPKVLNLKDKRKRSWRA